MIYLLNKETGLVQQLDKVVAAHDLSLFVMWIFNHMFLNDKIAQPKPNINNIISTKNSSVTLTI